MKAKNKLTLGDQWANISRIFEFGTDSQKEVIRKVLLPMKLKEEKGEKTVVDTELSIHVSERIGVGLALVAQREGEDQKQDKAEKMTAELIAKARK